MGTKQKSQQILNVLSFKKFFHSNLALLVPENKFYFQIWKRCKCVYAEGYKSHNNRYLSYVRHSNNKRQQKIDFENIVVQGNLTSLKLTF